MDSSVKNIDVLIVVDVEAALASENLGENVYLIDTNKYSGSGNEGQEELKTTCGDGQLISWRVAPISSSTDADIVSFTGEMIDQKICTPGPQGPPGDEYWEGRVESRGAAATYQYSVALSFDGKQMTFDPFIVVTAGT
jgi:hypothetical protein